MKNDNLIKCGNLVKESLDNGNFNKMFENIGIVSFVGFEDYSCIIRAIYYFQQNNFNKCLMELEKVCDPEFTDIPELRIFYWDYRIASMARLQKFDEIRDLFWSEEVVMTINGFAYAKYIAYKSGFEDIEPGIHRPDELFEPINLNDDRFNAYFYHMIYSDLLDIYNQNNERLLLKSAGVEERIKKDLKDHILKKIEYIAAFGNGKYLKLTSKFINFIKESRNRVIQDKVIDGKFLYELIMETLGNYNLNDVYNWSFIIDVGTELLTETELFNLISKYNSYIKDKIRDGNEVICKKMVSLTYCYKLVGFTVEDKDFMSFWREYIERYNPGFLEEHQVYACKKDIYEELTDSGKWAYRAAMWQYEQYDQNSTELMDAGLLSLAFMRILELEINNRMIIPLRKNCKNKLPKVLDESFSFLTSASRGNLMLGQLRKFMSHVRDKELAGSEKVYSILVETVLNEYGKHCLDEGVFDEMLRRSVVEKYRNPPAHARYLNKKEAIEAMHYVEGALPELFKCFLN